MEGPYLHQEKIPINTILQLKTHDHFGNLIHLSGNLHILAKVEYLACIWIGSPSGNTNLL